MSLVQIAYADGVVEGLAEDGVRRFLSLPYAAPMTQARRFKAPEAVDRWSGVRDATQAGPCAPQNAPEPMEIDFDRLMGIPVPPGPDYLTLNVFTPEAAAGRPVMVFVHGGGFVAGSKDAPIYDGRAFARDGVVCVVINYRLGIEGFLPAPGVPTNLGLRDMIAALQWVQDNIATFGGDPKNVTLFGESGGAWCIAALMTSPLVKGLVHRAICQSGHGYASRDLGHMQRLVKRLARRLKVSPDREGFAGAPADKFMAAQAWVLRPSLFWDMRDKDGRDPSFGVTRFLPVHGDDVLPVPTIDAFAQGATKDIDLLIGSTNSEEANLFFVPGGAGDRLRGWQAWLAARFAVRTPGALLRAYGFGQRGVRPGTVLTRAMTDLFFRAIARRTAELHRGRSWLYEFDWRSPALGGKLGAAHAIELPFVFDTLAAASGQDGALGSRPAATARRQHPRAVGTLRIGRGIALAGI
jgi:para-nitrobenzyl esterase